MSASSYSAYNLGASYTYDFSSVPNYQKLTKSNFAINGASFQFNRYGSDSHTHTATFVLTYTAGTGSLVLTITYTSPWIQGASASATDFTMNCYYCGS